MSLKAQTYGSPLHEWLNWWKKTLTRRPRRRCSCSRSSQSGSADPTSGGRDCSCQHTSGGRVFQGSSCHRCPSYHVDRRGRAREASARSSTRGGCRRNRGSHSSEEKKSEVPLRHTQRSRFRWSRIRRFAHRLVQSFSNPWCYHRLYMRRWNKALELGRHLGIIALMKTLGFQKCRPLTLSKHLFRRKLKKTILHGLSITNPDFSEFAFFW